MHRKMKVTFWGSFSDFAPKEWDCPPVPDLSTLRELLHNRFPQLNQRPCIIAVNKQVKKDNSPLTETDEIAVMPPFAGG